MKRIWGPFLLLLFLAGCAGGPAQKAEEGPVTLESIGLSAGLPPTFTVSEKSEAKNDNVSVRTFLGRSPDGKVLRIERLDGANATQGENFVRDKTFQINSIYEPNRDPYFSVLTTQTTCPDRFKPVRETGRNGDGEFVLTQLFANSRLTYGACTDDEAAYRAVIDLLRCGGNGRLYVLELFVPVKAFSDADARGMRSTGCK